MTAPGPPATASSEARVGVTGESPSSAGSNLLCLQRIGGICQGLASAAGFVTRPKNRMHFDGLCQIRNEKG
jgi:hypothetical protein